MYRNLDPAALGITGRQSELIELALTYGFKGLALNMSVVVKRARTRGAEQACRFVASAGIRAGESAVPLDVAAQEATFRSSLVELGEYAEIAAALKASSCRVTVTPVSEGMPYQENFELHRSRLADVADVLAPHNIRLGLAFRAAPSHREDCEAPFIHSGEALLTLIRTMGNSNVGLALDTWNWFVGGGTLEDLLAIPISTIASVRLADIPTTADLATITDQDRHMPGADGLIDCHAIVQHLVDSEFDGPLTLSPDPARFAGMTRDAIVQQAKATLDDLFKPSAPEPPAAEEPAEAEAASQ